ncbi:DUF4342 domain-containing protein [Clostridium cylindrosporum]|uniref:DUF4342 domain-containing protein n=1 Tax=Clostridium cylindrosporum DSM 605 TaxID=1121307 RepID=A0A0J8DBG8_CLOCY|nr:DUF4342 domain-containing protein [Clostridium cylindrosporum]KMT21659.1 hypothetical protein CLCY_2c04210 [Clostridium cylindrosporum DSM 605]
MEEATLEKIDIIRQRFGVSYEEAKKALEDNKGDLVETLIYMEQNKKGFSEVFTEKGNDLLETVKNIIEKGNVNRIKIKKGEKVLVDIPVTAGVAAGAISLLYTPILAIGAVTTIIAELKIEIERPNGEIEVLSNIIKKKSGGFKNTFEELTKKAMEKAEVARDKTERIVKLAMDKSSNIIYEADDKMIEIKTNTIDKED